MKNARLLYQSEELKPPDDSVLAHCVLYADDRHKHKVHVYIWPNLLSMREFTNPKDEHGAIFIRPEITIREGKVVETDVGYIHLVNDEFGAGMFAHELQHFIQGWIKLNDWEPTRGNWETVAYLAGDMTNQFWCWFYDNFEEERKDE